MYIYIYISAYADFWIGHLMDFGDGMIEVSARAVEELYIPSRA